MTGGRKVERTDAGALPGRTSPPSRSHSSGPSEPKPDRQAPDNTVVPIRRLPPATPYSVVSGDDVDDPVAKLKRLRGSLGKYQGMDRAISAIPVPPVRRALYGRLVPVEGIRHLSGAHDLTHPALPRARPRRRLSPGLALFGLALIGGAFFWTMRQEKERTAAAAPTVPAVEPSKAEPTTAAVAEELPSLSDAVVPQSVWLVEKGQDWEQYSNGLRIDTTYTIAGDPRAFRVFDRKSGIQPTVYREPVGLLFHTSESDIWPLDPANNENLRVSSQRLLRYVQRIKAYHYLVDRFGRVFRVVDQGSKANHAGNSIWADGNAVYLSLNNAFLGVCFETRWEGGRALPITQAQLTAGRNLTDYLRHQFKIVPEMCVAHGLTSVNPKKRLIGHHVDWARGFPFGAFGLPDQYVRPAPSVALFGFGYDDKFLAVMGEPWQGVRMAEISLAEEATRMGRPLESLRQEKQALYDRWVDEQARADGAAQSPAGATAPARGPRGG